MEKSTVTEHPVVTEEYQQRKYNGLELVKNADMERKNVVLQPMRGYPRMIRRKKAISTDSKTNSEIIASNINYLFSLNSVTLPVDSIPNDEDFTNCSN